MTDIEKYNCIEDMFIGAFGEDFHMAQALGLSQSEYSKILSRFQNQVRLQVGAQYGDSEAAWDAVKAVNFQRLYGGMSVNDVREAIRAKYPDKLSNREFLLILEELDSVGISVQDKYSVGSLVSTYKSRLINTMVKTIYQETLR